MTYYPISVSDESLAEFKKICEKEGIKYDTEAEYRDSANKLLNFMNLLVEGDMEERERKARLEKEPKGYAITSEGRTCHLCGRSMYEDMWYDKWGMKCMVCQDALNKKIIPGYVFRDYKNEKHITASTLSWKLEIHTSTIRKLARQGKLKARTVPGNGTLVFLRKENPDIAEIIETEKAGKAKSKNS